MDFIWEVEQDVVNWNINLKFKNSREKESKQPLSLIILCSKSLLPRPGLVTWPKWANRNAWWGFRVTLFRLASKNWNSNIICTLVDRWRLHKLRRFALGPGSERRAFRSADTWRTLGQDLFIVFFTWREVVGFCEWERDVDHMVHRGNCSVTHFNELNSCFNLNRIDDQCFGFKRAKCGSRVWAGTHPERSWPSLIKVQK